LLVGHVGHLVYDLLQEVRVELVLARLAAPLGVQLSWLHSGRVCDLLPLGNWLVDLLDSSEFVFILLLIGRRALAQKADFVVW